MDEYDEWDWCWERICRECDEYRSGLEGSRVKRRAFWWRLVLVVGLVGLSALALLLLAGIWWSWLSGVGLGVLLIACGVVLQGRNPVRETFGGEVAQLFLLAGVILSISCGAIWYHELLL